MLKMECLEGRKLIEKEISFQKVIDIINQKLENYSTVKTIFEIPSEKGLGLHQVTEWEDKEEVTTELYNNNFIISDSVNSIAINKDANILIFDRNNTLTILFKDYNLQLVMVEGIK